MIDDTVLFEVSIIPRFALYCTAEALFVLMPVIS